MKKHRVIAILIILAAVAATVTWRLRPRQLPNEECSAIFLRYKDNDHIKTAFIKDFPINDSITVDVTTLQATDSVGWATLVEDCKLNLTEFEQYKHLFKGKDYVILWSAYRGDPGAGIDPQRTNYSNYQPDDSIETEECTASLSNHNTTYASSTPSPTPKEKPYSQTNSII